MKFVQRIAAAVAFAGMATMAAAQNVSVGDGWVRVSVQGQSASAAFMTLTARQATRLVGASSPVAGITEIHEMKMDGGVMKMRALEGGLDIPAGKTVALTSGGVHVMLMDLKAALPKGSRVPLTLIFRDASGTESQLTVTLPVAAAGLAHKH